jgi:hypothetical protein
MMSFLTYITGFFMNFELLPVLTDYEIKKRGDEIKKKSSPLKLLSQFQPNFAEMILRWSPVKYVKKLIIMLIVQIWALSGLKSSSFGHLKKFLFLVMVAILDTGRHKLKTNLLL